MIKKILILISFCFALSCASTPSRTLSGEEIPEGVDTIVVASKKSADDFYKELKNRAVDLDFVFKSTDSDTRLFVTEFMDLSRKSSVSLKVYVKQVKGGSNAVVSGTYLKLKKLKKGFRPQSVEHRGSSGSAVRQAWDKVYNFALGSKKWKYNFIKR